MERLNELYLYKEKYEKEALFANAKVAVVDEMIADEKAKLSEVVEEASCEENHEEAIIEEV